MTTKTIYRNAPISELNVGIIFQRPLLKEGGTLFEFSTLLKDDFPEILTHTPILEEELNQYRLSTSIDYENAGDVCYSFRNNGLNHFWRIQDNMALLSWIRPDNESVGKYPGFDSIFDTFYFYFQNLVKLLEKNAGISRQEIILNVKYLVLTYQDRFAYGAQIQNLAHLQDITNISIPLNNSLNFKYIPNNVFSKYTYPMPELNGYGILGINTATNIEDKQLLSVYFSIKGNIRKEDESLQDWFQRARKEHHNLFEDIFSESLKKSWL